MRKAWKWGALALAASMVLSAESFTAYASEVSEEPEPLISVNFDGTVLNFDPPPVIEDGYISVPIESTDEETNTVNIASSVSAPDPAADKPFHETFAASVAKFSEEIEPELFESLAITRKSLDGIEFAEFYVNDGEKKPVLFYFGENFDALSEDFLGMLHYRFVQHGIYVVAVEMAGQGESRRPGPDLKLDLWVESAGSIDKLVDYFAGKADGQADASRYAVDSNHYDSATAAFIHAATGQNTPAALMFSAGAPDPAFFSHNEGEGWGEANSTTTDGEDSEWGTVPVTDEMLALAEELSSLTNIERYTNMRLHWEVADGFPMAHFFNDLSAFFDELEGVVTNADEQLVITEADEDDETKENSAIDFIKQVFEIE